MNGGFKIKKGVNIEPVSGSTVTQLGDIATNSSTNKVEFYNGTSASPLVTEAHTATLTNKILTGNTAANLVSGSGTMVLNTTGTVTLPNATDTLVGKATTDTLTNKTLTGNTAANLISGSGTLVLNTSGTITAPNGTDTLAGVSLNQTLTNKVLSGNTATSLVNGSGTFNFNSSGTITAPNATDTLVGKATTDTLTNKTLSGNTATNLVNGSGTFNFNSSGTLTAPNATDTLVGRATTDTLTNKTLTGNTAVNLVSGSGTTIFNTSGTVTLPNATDTLVGKATVDTLTNKTFGDAPTFTEIATPSNPSSGFLKIYPKTDNFLYSLDSTGLERKIGSGSGSGATNYIQNPDAESSTLGWATYQDSAGLVPVNGTGGTPNITLTRSTSSPLRGTASFLITKDAADRQGEGVSYDFTIDSADKSHVLNVSFDYNAPSPFTASSGLTSSHSDIEVFVLDITNSVLVPVVPQVLTASGTSNFTFEGQFQASTSTDYRLILHIPTTNASAWTFKFDNVFVGPQSVSAGSPVSDWTDYTPTGSWTTNTTYTGKWRRVGDVMQVQVKVLLTGAPDAVNLLVNIPDGYSIDPDKLVDAVTFTSLVTSRGVGISGGAFDLSALYNNSSSVIVIYQSNGTTSQVSAVTDTAPVTWTSGNYIEVFFEVPILGWSSNIQIGEGDTRVVAARAYNSTAIAFNPTPSFFLFDTLELDTHGTFDIGSGTYTVPVSGNYRISAALLFDTAAYTAGNNGAINVYVNGSGAYILDRFQIEANNSKYQQLSGSTLLPNLKAGDTIQLAVDNSRGATSLIASGPYNWVSIERVSGASTPAAGEFIGAKYFYNGGGTLNNAVQTTPTYDIKGYNTHNAYSPSTGIFTVPVSGYYRVTGSFVLDAHTPTNGSNYVIVLVKNGSNYTEIGRTQGSAFSSFWGAKGSDSVNCVAGDEIYIQIYQDSGSPQNLVTNASFNYVTFEKIG